MQNTPDQQMTLPQALAEIESLQDALSDTQTQLDYLKLENQAYYMILIAWIPAPRLDDVLDRVAEIKETLLHWADEQER